MDIKKKRGETMKKKYVNKHDLLVIEAEIMGLRKKLDKLSSSSFYVKTKPVTRLRFVSDNSLSPWSGLGYLGYTGMPSGKIEPYEHWDYVEVPLNEAIQAILDHLKLELTVEEKKEIPQKVGAKKIEKKGS